MCNNFYLQEKLGEEHLRDLHREISQQHILAGLSRKRYSVGKHLASRLGTHLVALGRWLEGVEQHDNIVVPITGTLQRYHK